MTALLDATKEWYFNVDQDNINAGWFFLICDKWIDSRLVQLLFVRYSNRKQVSVVDGRTSQHRTVTCGPCYNRYCLHVTLQYTLGSDYEFMSIRSTFVFPASETARVKDCHLRLSQTELKSSLKSRLKSVVSLGC